MYVVYGLLTVNFWCLAVVLVNFVVVYYYFIVYFVAPLNYFVYITQRLFVGFVLVGFCATLAIAIYWLLCV